MPKESQNDPRKNFAVRHLPWLLGVAMLLLFGATLNHWINLLNLAQVATVSGYIWQPQIFNPLTFLVTLPFRIFPAAHVPLALNLFSALCAAATLAVLARSIAILPHDRTEMERMRERSDFAFLTGWVAWLPPIIAVVFVGFQLSFWEQATNFTGESFELLLFAIILWQLLEYRLDEREGRLYFVAVLYGACIPENWAMIPYFPLFITMLIWLRRLDFFNARFLFRMTLCGVGGMLLFLLLPLLAKISASYPLSFWEALKPALRADWMVIKTIKSEGIRHDIGLVSLTSFLPAFLMAIRWSSSFGDSSRMGTTLVNYFLHFVYAIIFGVLLWVTFDPPFGPHGLMQDMGINAPALTLYYVIALCIGYYSGYLLLVFGQEAKPGRRNNRPDPALPKPLMWLCPMIVGAILAVSVLGAGLLFHKNVSVVRAVNDDTFLKFAQFSTENLPRNGAILLCDSDDPTQDAPLRGFAIQSLLARDHRDKNYPVVDTQALNWPPYHQYLHKRYPQIWPQTLATNDITAINPLRIFLLLGQFAKSNNLCYLNPSFGYYFEQFYQEPHGMVYAMKTLPEETLLPPPLDKNLIAENDAFWNRVMETSQASVEHALHPTDFAKQNDWIGHVMTRLHVSPEPNPNAVMVGTFYSRGLDFYGVQAQRANELQKAAALFANAAKLNPENRVAAENANFNKLLRAGSSDISVVRDVSLSQFGKSVFTPTWNQVLGPNGPFDATSFCFDYGAWLMQGGLMRQATAQFDRVRQFAPDNLAARLFLAQIYIFARQPDQALAAMHDPLTRPLRFALTEYNSTELDVLAAAAHFQKNETTAAVHLLEQEVARHPDDEMLLMASAQSFMMRGLYTNALKVINHKLERSPDDVQWIYGKGYASVQTGNYKDAVAAFTRVLEMQTNNADALFNRGFAYYQNGQFDAARTDFRRLQSAYTNSFQVAYGLGEIAWKDHDTNEAIREYQIYLANAPTNSAEFKGVRERMRELKVTGDK